MKVRYSVLLFLLAVAVLQLIEVANAAAFVCKADIVTRSGDLKEVSGWMHAESAERAHQAWMARVRGEHHPRRIDLPRCTVVRGSPRR